MNDSWQGCAAVVIFLVLVVFFLAAAAAAAPTLVATPGGAGTGETTIFAAPAVATPVVVTPAESNTIIIVPPASQPSLAADGANVEPAVIIVNEPSSVATVYTVQPGDWLSDIASRYNTTVPAILAANPQITNPDLIQPGETLVIPNQ